MTIIYLGRGQKETFLPSKGQATCVCGPRESSFNHALRAVGIVLRLNLLCVLADPFCRGKWCISSSNLCFVCRFSILTWYQGPEFLQSGADGQHLLLQAQAPTACVPECKSEVTYTALWPRGSAKSLVAFMHVRDFAPSELQFLRISYWLVHCLHLSAKGNWNIKVQAWC